MNSEFSDSMDASLLQLERELQSLTPAPPGRELLRSLQARMEPETAAPQVNKIHAFPWRRMVTPAAAAAAAVAVLSVNNPRRTTGFTGGVSAHESTPAIKWEPMPMLQKYRALINAGYVLNENFEPVPQSLVNPWGRYEWGYATDDSLSAGSAPNRYLVPAAYDEPDTWSARKRMQFQ